MSKKTICRRRLLEYYSDNGEGPPPPPKLCECLPGGCVEAVGDNDHIQKNHLPEPILPGGIEPANYGERGEPMGDLFPED